METNSSPFEKYIFVCENQRTNDKCCAPLGIKIRELLKEKVHERGLSRKIRVSRSGCLDVCSEGPNVLLMPDNVWFKHVKESDVEEIMRRSSS
jgi:(2Fe-2S) ferredoxin